MTALPFLSNVFLRTSKWVCLTSLCLVIPTNAKSAESSHQVQIHANSQKIEASFDGSPAFTYWLQKPEGSACASPNAAYFHPVTTPSGIVLTDLAPDDHLHHRGVFVSWLEVRNKIGEGDFWGWGKFAKLEGRIIRPSGTISTSSSNQQVQFSATQDWLAEQTPILHEKLVTKVDKVENAMVYDLTYEFSAKEDTTLGQHAFSGFTFRARKDAEIQALDSSGVVSLAAPHHLKPESNWPDRPWYAFELTLKDGKKVGFAILNGKANPKTTWHNITKIGMMNPCIIAPGPVKIDAKQGLRLNYKIVAFDGETPTTLLEKLTKNH